MLLLQSLSNISHGLGVSLPLLETHRTIHGIHRQRIKRGHHRVDSIAKLLPRDDTCALRVSDFDKRLAQ